MRHGRKSRGGGGIGGHVPPLFLKVGDIISNVPPLFLGWMIINWNEDPFYSMFSDVMDLFFFSFFCCLLVRKVCDGGWVPLFCVWKIEQKMSSWKKKVSDPTDDIPSSSLQCVWGSVKTGANQVPKAISDHDPLPDWVHDLIYVRSQPLSRSRLESAHCDVMVLFTKERITFRKRFAFTSPQNQAF